jgi:hypothetical protein
LDRGQLAIIAALFGAIALLLAILFMLVSIGRNGLSLHLAGDINLADLGDQITVKLTMDQPVTLAIPQPVQMVAAGPDGGAIPASLSFAMCPSCGASMLPSKWNPWNGQIEWTCPDCTGASQGSPAP